MLHDRAAPADEFLDHAVNSVPVPGAEHGRLSPKRRLVELLMRSERLCLNLTGLAFLIGAWQLCANLGLLSPRLMGSPSGVLTAGVGYVTSPQFGGDVRSSSFEFVTGFGLALAVGIPLGFAIALFRRLDYLLDPILTFLYAAPRIAIAPLLVLWFGIDLASKVAIVFLMAVFPIIVNTAQGVRSVDPDLLDLAHSFNASPWQRLLTVIAPSSIPFVVTGVRLGIGVAFIGVVVGEFVAATSGIGFAIRQSAGDFNVNLMLVGVIMIGAAGVLLTEALRQLENRLEGWRIR